MIPSTPISSRFRITSGELMVQAWAADQGMRPADERGRGHLGRDLGRTRAPVPGPAARPSPS